MAKKILLIEYEPRYLDRIRGHLAGRDFELVVAKDGDEGLEAYRKGRPDLVLISSVLPKLRTPDVIKGMQAVGPTPPILLMVSGYKGKNKKADAQRVGASSILEKPFSEEVFLAELETAMGARADAGAGLPFPTATATGGGLLSSDDIFSDVISGMDEEPRPASLPTGTDPGIQKKLEQTLSGILPAPRRTATPGGTKVDVPAPAPRSDSSQTGRTAAPRPAAPADKPAPKAPERPNAAFDQLVSDRTVRVEVMSLQPPAPPSPPAPAPPKSAERPADRPAPRVDSSVDRMLTETLSGLKAARNAPAPERPAAPAVPRVDNGAAAQVAQAAKEKAERERAERERAERDRVERERAERERAERERADRERADRERADRERAEQDRSRAVSQERRRDVTGTGTTFPGGFGRYQLLEKIAAGGMAEVFKARMRGEEGFEKIVAIKRILPHMADNDDFITMFVDEAKLAAQLTHNNIIHIYDLGKVDAYHYIAMEYVDGKDLRSILKQGNERGYPLPPELAILVASKIANALDYAHRRMGMDGKELNLVHRDVSPQNILISFEGDIKLCDFGIAKAATKVSQTQTGALKGKLQYMSPEQAWGKKIDRRTDIFSLGIVLFEMLTGERLFTGDTDLTILEQVRDAKVVAPSTKNPDVPKKLDQVVLKALAKNPQDRYQNASEFEKELLSILYSYQPTPGPADLAIYMHRLLEAQPVASDEAIDAAFAKAEREGPGPAEPTKKGKGLVISKKAPAPEKAREPEPERRPEPERPIVTEVSRPALSMGAEPPKSRAGLFIGIGAVAVVGVVAVFLLKGKGGTPAPQPTPAPVPTEAAAGTPSTEAPGPTATPVKVVDPKAVEAEARRILEERAKLTPTAAAAPATAPTKPGVVPPAAPTAVSFAPKATIAPPVAPTAPPAAAPTKAPEPTATPLPKVEVKPTAAPVAAEPAAAEPPPNAPVKVGDLVGPGEGVVEPRVTRLSPITGLPPQARNIQRGKGEPLGTPLILALIDENGKVAEVRIVKASPYKFVDDAAVNALKGSAIEPATKNGVKVKMWKTFAIPVKP